MMQFQKLFRLALLAVLALGLTAAVVRAGDPPHVGSLETTTVNVSFPSEWVVRYELTLEGRGTVLGPFSGTAVYELDLTTGAYVGVVAKAGRDGSAVYEVLVGQFNETFTGSVGTFWVIGGTGRFEGATGGGTFVGRVTSATTGAFDYDGEIAIGR